MCIRDSFQTLQIAPALLESMPTLNESGTAYDCKLRKDARWDDGTPITTADVVFTAMASKCPVTDNPAAKPYWDNPVSYTHLDVRYKFLLYFTNGDRNTFTTSKH